MASDLPMPQTSDLSNNNNDDDNKIVNIGINNKLNNINKTIEIDIDIDSVISISKANIRDILNNSNSFSDSSLLQGALSFGHSKFTNYLLDSLYNQYNILSNDSVFAKNFLNSNSIGNVVDRVWIEIHHPTIKYFQSAFHQLNKSVKNDNNSGNNNNNSMNLNNNKKQQYQKKYSKYNNVSSSSSNNTNVNNSINIINSNNNSQLFVEYRKLFDRFVKFISKAYDFYFFLLKSILNNYDLSIYIPVKKICSTLKIDLSSLSDSKDSRLPLLDSNILVSSIIYLTHKCVLFIGDLSRYRTLIAKTYLPTTAISKEDNNNYSKSIELYKLSLLILPSLGDPYNHIAIIDNLKDDKFNVVYNFIRASLTSSPLNIAHSNLFNLLNKHPRTNSILRKFEHLNSLDRNTVTKNDRLDLLKSQFLILFNYNLLPTKWKLKPGFLISGHSINLIENDFYHLLSNLDFHKQIFNDFYFKQLVILTGGFEILIDTNFSKDIKLTQSADIISDYLNFLFRYLEIFLKICIGICDSHLTSKFTNNNVNNNDKKSDKNENHLQNVEIVENLENIENLENTYSSNLKMMSFSTSLLPVIRLLLCWFKEREIARVYLQRSKNVSNLLSLLINKFISIIDRPKIEEVFRQLSIETNFINSLNSILNEKPIRQRLFKEDVSLREFKPINYALNDFDDSHLYKKNSESVLALIGELPDFQEKENDKIINENDEFKRPSNGTGANIPKIGSSTKISDNLLRLIAIIVLGKKLILENAKEIEWVNEVVKIGDNDNVENFNSSLGRFKIIDDIDIKINVPVIPALNNTLANENSNSSTNNTRSKDSNRHSKIKKNDLLRNNNNSNNNNNTNNNTNNNSSSLYAGSSFSTFGSPSSESFGKFDKYKRNKSANKVLLRPQLNSTSSSQTLKKTTCLNEINYQLQQRPMTSPGFNEKKSNEESQSHSQYVNMVASIVNEEHNKNDNKIKENGSNSINTDNFGNIGITRDNKTNDRNDHHNGNNATSSNYKEDSNLNNSSSSFLNSGYMNYFNQWNSFDNSSSSLDETSHYDNNKEKQPHVKNGNNNNNNNLINQMKQMDLIGSIDTNNFSLPQVNQFNQFGLVGNNSNLQNFNINHMINNMNNIDSISNINNLNINNYDHMNINTNMNRMTIDNVNPMHSLNMNNIQVNSMHNIPMNMPMDMNINRNMDMNMNINMNMDFHNMNIHNFNPMNPIGGLNNNMNMSNIALNPNRMNSTSFFTNETVNMEKSNSPSSSAKNQ